MQNQNTHAMLNIASRLTRQANYCQQLLTSGLGIPVILINGCEANKRDARQLINQARKLRLARELAKEYLTYGMTEKARKLNNKLVLVALR